HGAPRRFGRAPRAMSLRPRHAGLLFGLLFPALPATAGQITIEAHAVQLDPAHPDVTRTGELDFVGGLTLLSDDGRFGGWSGMLISPDGGHLVLISDIGWWLTAELTRENGRITGFRNTEIGPLLSPDGKPLGGDKMQGDAESLAVRADGSMIVAFEQEHRILRYPAQADGSLPLRHAPDTLPIPPDLNRADPNGGLEALTALPDGALFGFSEDLLDDAGHHQGWRFAGPDGAPPRAVALDVAADFKPTDLKRLASGEFLLLERRYDMMTGPGARLSILPATAPESAGPIAGRELARIPAELTVDNSEALGVWRDETGKTRALVLSDDNFNPLQRTLLMEFVLP
ncbi:esterase-like activity of phytase family protein, partial [Zavarzinia sp.]|uniref:esterase-like activity of phytase family protein n=1 Tax=Zavarzinia sp. TaxID=2027920 RepID=UPI003BB499BD